MTVLPRRPRIRDIGPERLTVLAYWVSGELEALPADPAAAGATDVTLTPAAPTCHAHYFLAESRNKL
jgi:hypothetical protein